MHRLWNLIWMCLLGGVLVLILGSFEAGSSLGHTCVLCRLMRRDTTMFGFTRTRYQETDCSRWYAYDVEPRHDHIWERGTCRTMLNAFGLPMGVGCRPGQYPIHLLSPDTQMRAYQHFRDPHEAEALFRSLADEKLSDDRLDEHDQSKGDLIVRSLAQWEAAGFPGTWNDWWARWWEDHVAEHKDWLRWLESSGGMNYEDWKAHERKPSTTALKPPG